MGRSPRPDGAGDRDFVEKLKGMKDAVIKGSVKDQPSDRMMQSVEAEALIKQAADYFRLVEADLTRKRRRHRQERALVMELLHRLHVTERKHNCQDKQGSHVDNGSNFN